MLLVFRKITVHVGVEAIGVWSLVSAAASVSRVADLGLSQAVVPLMARYRATGDSASAARLLETAVLTIGLALAAVGMAAYPFVTRLVAAVSTALSADQVAAFARLTLFSFWLSAVAAVIQGGFDAAEQMHMRAGVVLAGHAILLGAVWVLVPTTGLAGVFWAQLLQAAATLALGWSTVRRWFPSLRWLWLRWSGTSFRELRGYGAGVQLSALFSLALDPAAKLLLARFGGSVMLGYFEIANQVVLRIRSLLVAANQAVVPVVAGLAVRDAGEIRRLYVLNVRALAATSGVAFGGLMLGAEYVAQATLGRPDAAFTHLLRVIALGWWLNTLNVPAYFANLGSGRLKWNVISHAAIAALNLLLATAGGQLSGAGGVVAGYVVALVCGSSIVVVAFHRQNRLPLSSLWKRAVEAREGSSVGWP